MYVSLKSYVHVQCTYAWNFMYICVHLKFYVRMLEILCTCTYAWNCMYIYVHLKLYVRMLEILCTCTMYACLEFYVHLRTHEILCTYKLTCNLMYMYVYLKYYVHVQNVHCEIKLLFDDMMMSVLYKTDTLVVICTDCTGSCKSNYHTITTTTAP